MTKQRQAWQSIERPVRVPFRIKTRNREIVTSQRLGLWQVKRPAGAVHLKPAVADPGCFFGNLVVGSNDYAIRSHQASVRDTCEKQLGVYFVRPDPNSSGYFIANERVRRRCDRNSLWATNQTIMRAGSPM